MPAEVANPISLFIGGQIEAVKAAAGRRICEERAEIEELVGRTDALREELAAAQACAEHLENQLVENVGRLKLREDDMAALRTRIVELEATTVLIEKAAAAAVALSEVNAAGAIALAERVANKSVAEAEKAVAVAIARLDRTIAGG